MTTKKKNKIFGLFFVAALMVAIAGISTLIAFNGDATPPTQSEPTHTRMTAVDLGVYADTKLLLQRYL